MTHGPSPPRCASCGWPRAGACGWSRPVRLAVAHGHDAHVGLDAVLADTTFLQQLVGHGEHGVTCRVQFVQCQQNDLIVGKSSFPTKGSVRAGRQTRWPSSSVG